MVVLVDEGPGQGVGGLFSLEEERDGDLRVFRLAYRRGTAKLAYVSGVLVVARRLVREGTPVDVLHAHVHRMGWAAVLASPLLRRPVVISEHSSEWTQATITRGALLRARAAFRRAALVCPVSASLQDAIESYGVRARFRVVPNAVDTRIFHPPPNPPADPPARLVNVALHNEVKGVDVLLRAFARLAGHRAEATLELVGEGPQTRELEELASDLGIGERVRFVGALGAAAVAEALRRSHVFVAGSRSETLGVAVAEALCCGLPVAATNVGGVPELVGADDGVLAPPENAEALAEAIETSVSGYARFDRAAIAARARSRFSLEAVGRTWDQIYRSV